MCKSQAWLKGSRPERSMLTSCAHECKISGLSWLTHKFWDNFNDEILRIFWLVPFFFHPNLCRFHRRVWKWSTSSFRPAGVLIKSLGVWGGISVSNWSDFSPLEYWGEMADRSMRALKEKLTWFLCLSFFSQIWGWKSFMFFFSSFLLCNDQW